MDFKIITSKDAMWSRVRDYAQNCSWRAGKSLAAVMKNMGFMSYTVKLPRGESIS